MTWLISIREGLTYLLFPKTDIVEDDTVVEEAAHVCDTCASFCKVIRAGMKNEDDLLFDAKCRASKPLSRWPPHWPSSYQRTAEIDVVDTLGCSQTFSHGQRLGLLRTAENTSASSDVETAHS